MKMIRRPTGVSSTAPIWTTIGLLVLTAMTLAIGAISHDRPLVAVSFIAAILAGAALGWDRILNASFTSRRSAPHVPDFLDKDGHADPVEPTSSFGVSGRKFPIEDYDRLRVDEILPLLPALEAAELKMVQLREEFPWRRRVILDRIESLLAGPDVRPAKAPFPIEGYGQMRVVDVLPRLKALTPEELAVVALHEQETAGRRTILSRIARLQERHQRLPGGRPDPLDQ